MCLVPAILCGGVGARLWPVSRELHPKPFIRMADGESLLQKAFIRGVALPDVQEILTVTNRELYFMIEDEFREVNKTNRATSFILEPFGRNTAPAVACAALQAQRLYGNKATLLILAADHLIKNSQAFAEAVDLAIIMAQQGKLVTFGIRPDSPETGYGYIEADGTEVKRFVEKPTMETAKTYLQTGRFLWNSGMFCFTADTILSEMERHCLAIVQSARECMEKSRTDEHESDRLINLNSEYFKVMPSISIDYAVMEKSSNVAVVPCEIGWSDIGTWSALSEFAPIDESGNYVEGQAMLHNAQNCYVRSGERLTGLVGTQNLVIVDTPDALLIADKAHTQDVKYIFSELKAKGHTAHRLHRTVYRPWGTSTVLDEGPRYKIKRIVVKPGASLSEQLQRGCSKHWFVLSGSARVINNDNEIYLNSNESTMIFSGDRHRLVNHNLYDLVMIEILSSDDCLIEDYLADTSENEGEQVKK